MSLSTAALAWIETERDRGKVRLPGTDRAEPPTVTKRLAEKAGASAGVTRVADVTRLDTIGIPTFQAVRPLSRTLAVSQGKGVTRELAHLSALMESIEMWHCEQPLVADLVATPKELVGHLDYSVSSLPQVDPSLLHDALPLQWMRACSIEGGRPSWAPLDSVRVSLEVTYGWNPPTFVSSTNGLASGNSLIEATLHGLYEVIERDAVTSALDDRDLGARVSPRSLGAPEIDYLCDLVERAHVELDVRLVASRTGLPCFAALLFSQDFPTAMYGFGAHLSPDIALSRAITEAAQTRLTYISGARDDASEYVGSKSEPVDTRPTAARGDIGHLLDSAPRHRSLTEDLALAVRAATSAFGYPPLVVDLSRSDIGVPVVKVIAPGSRVTTELL